MKGIHGILAAGGFAVYAAVGAAAFAQPAAATSPPARGEMMARAPSPAEQAEQLRDLLQLRPAQERALQTYVAALETAHRGMMGDMDMSAQPRTTPERLARMQQMMAAHQSAMTGMIEATRRFYDQLDAGQKRAFDALPMMTLHGGMMRHRMGARGGMGEPPPGR